MKEELTTLMHSEFSVSKDIEIRNKVIAAMTVMSISKKRKLEDVIASYGITMKDYERWKHDWIDN